MMTGVYANNPVLRDKAAAERTARLEAKRADVAARLEAMKGNQR